MSGKRTLHVGRTLRGGRMVASARRWPTSEWEPRTPPARLAPLFLVTGGYLVWWFLSLTVGSLWLALRQPTTEVLDDIRSLGDGR